jgi:hypothetical protein
MPAAEAENQIPSEVLELHKTLERTWTRGPGLLGWLLQHESQRHRHAVRRHRVHFFGLAGVLALMMRIQLARPKSRFWGRICTTSSSPFTARR